MKKEHLNQTDDRKSRTYRFLIFAIFTGLGVLIAWILFDYQPPGGIIIIAGATVGGLVNMAIYPNGRANRVPSGLEMRSEGHWPFIRKLSAIMFLIFFFCGHFFLSPKLMSNAHLRRSLLFLFMGLGLLAGTPIMFALKSNLRLMGWCSLGTSLALVLIGLLGIFKIQVSSLVMLFSMVMGMIGPLLMILFYLRRK